MSAKLPIVLDGTGQLQQLQSTDDLNIPLTDQVRELEVKLTLLAHFLLEEGFDVPDELIKD